MGLSPALFVCLFLAGLGIFLAGAGAIWWVSLQAGEIKRRQADARSADGRPTLGTAA